MSTSSFDFGTVDAAGDPAPFVSYLEGVNAWDAITAGRSERTALLTAGGRRALLDVGCGLGDDARAMASALGPDGRVVGLDSSAGLVAEARARTGRDAHGLTFEVADGSEMPFEDDTFDGARFERVLQHVTDPDAMLRETRRVVRPGGLVVAAEPDWGAIALDAEPGAVRALIDAFERHIRHPWMGRQLRRRFADAGLRDVTVSVETLVTTDVHALRAISGVHSPSGPLAQQLGPQHVAAFAADIEARSAAGRLFVCSPLVVAVGAVPG